MIARNKIIIWASIIIFLFAGGLFLWSPQAYVEEKLSVKDLVLLRLVARAHTLWPINEIQTEGDDMASVIAGEKFPWAHYSKSSWTAYDENGNAFYTCYYFKRTKHGWVFSDSPPPVAVDFGTFAPSHAVSVAFQIIEFVGVSMLAFFWCLRKESRWRIQVAIYTWLILLPFSFGWCLLMPTHFLRDLAGKQMSDDSYSYYGMIAVIAFGIGWSLPSVVVFVHHVPNKLFNLFRNFTGRQNLFL